MTDANNTSSSPAFPTPFSHLQHLLILGGKTGQSPKIRRNPGATRTQDGNEERLARARETERERERKRWCSWTRSSTTDAEDGCTRRTSASSELGARKTTSRERERERERSVTGRYALRSSAPTREEREREKERLVDRPTDRSMLAWVADLFCSSLHLAARAGKRRGHHLVLLSTLCWVSRIASSRTSTWSTLLLLRGRGSSLAT